MDINEELALVRSHVAQLEEKLKGQRRELDALRKQVATLQDIVQELERQLEDDALNE
jgi:septal ring factor EnvC (AmiA/AmiB activator)